MKSKEDSTIPTKPLDGRKRVTIGAVAPEIDDGRYPIKRTAFPGVEKPPGWESTTASTSAWLKNLSHVSFEPMQKRYQEQDRERILDAVELLTQERLRGDERARIARSASEIDFVKAALEDTMVTAFHQIREVARSTEANDLRTAAYHFAIQRVAASYQAQGIFP